MGNGFYFGGLVVVVSFVIFKDYVYFKKLGVGDLKIFID